MKDIPPNYKIISLDKVGSTNEEANKIAEQDGFDGVVIISAKEQTDGKGRKGRKWIQKEGSLALSAAISLGVDVETAGNLSLVSSLVARDAINELAEGIDVKIKWPNDIMISGKKAGGILLGSVTSSDNRTVKSIIIGMGINVASSPGEKELSTQASLIQYKATSLKEEGATNTEVDVLLEAVAFSLSKWMNIWDKGRGFDKVVEEWRKNSFLGGGDKIKVGGIDGEYVDINEKGFLLLKPGGSKKVIEINVGDVKKEISPAGEDLKITK